MDVSRAFLRSEPMGRDTYVKLPEGVERENVAWELLKPYMAYVQLVYSLYRPKTSFFKTD